MKTLSIEIPEDILEMAQIPPEERESTLRLELAVHLVARGMLPRAAARRLAGMERVAFEDLLGRRGVTMGLTAEDVDEDLRNFASWKAGLPQKRVSAR
ncbi:MAG: UPF0175 family protein [Myxococcota bacterium]